MMTSYIFDLRLSDRKMRQSNILFATESLIIKSDDFSYNNRFHFHKTKCKQRELQKVSVYISTPTWKMGTYLTKTHFRNIFI